MPLDPNKFIMPVLPYGPNNQLRGFRETIILAIKLNRTVVMPPFYKHRSDPSPGEIRLVFSKFFFCENWVYGFRIFVENGKSYPWRKIDEDELRKFITVASPGKSRQYSRRWIRADVGGRFSSLPQYHGRVLKQFLDEFRSKCNGKFDVSFTAREDSGEAAGKLKRLEQLERFAEMKILTPADGAKENYKPYLNSIVV